MPELLTRSDVQPILDWYKSFDGMPYEQAADRLSQEAIAACDGDVDGAIGYELAMKLADHLNDEGEAEFDWIIRNIPCRLAF